jgi:allophanate hydrolase
MDLSSLRRAYRDATASPIQIVEEMLTTIERDRTPGVWIHRRDAGELRAEARALEAKYSRSELPPLYGVPFGVKDSIDVAGVPTTVGCPAFEYVARSTAPVVERLRAAGALYVGKTNLDQFATGLVGVRSPYGVPPNPFDARYVTGGSSSGSAAAVARGHVSFAIATDTAGSGRVPASFNNIVGLKPSLGLFSTMGLVPACRSVDCMTIMSLTCEDARTVAAVATAFDPRDPFSRTAATGFRWNAAGKARRVAVPRPEDRVFGDDQARRAFDGACETLAAIGLEVEPVPMEVFYEAGRLLYGGPWIAERLTGLEDFLAAHPDAFLPVIRDILSDGEKYRATDAFRARHRLAELVRDLAPLWRRVSALVVPTAPQHPTIEAVLADPIAENARLGKYTTFANLLDLAGVAVPAGFRKDGLPFGVTFLGPWGSDAVLLNLGTAFHRKAGVTLGATGRALPPDEPTDASPSASSDEVVVAVVGAHLQGQPLNHQLTDRGSRLVRVARTSPHYKLVALPDTQPPKPGLLRVASGGVSIEIELWAMPLAAFGSFVAGVGSPLAIGSIEVADGSRVHGFLCESVAADRAEDISSYGGWRAYVRRAEGKGSA